MRLRRTLLSLVAVSSLASGCRYFRPIDPNAPSPSAQPEPVAEVPAPAPSADTAAVQAAPPPEVPVDPRRREIGRVNDRTITAMLLASNNTDISYARLVPARSERDDVRRFAQRMLTDHNGVNALVTELLAKRGWSPEDNTASLDLRDESAGRRDAMRDLSGFAFDSAYTTNEISYHRRFLELLDNTMIPRARNDELKGLLMNVRPAVAAHLAHAEQLWANVMTKK
jgi:putative membrane protein